MSKIRIPLRVMLSILFCFSANSFIFIRRYNWMLLLALALFLLVSALCGFPDPSVRGFRNKVLSHGTEALITFVISVIVSGVFHILLVLLTPREYSLWLWSALVSYIAHLILFWNGIISVYATSIQLGIKPRIIGLICGPVPIAHLFALKRIIDICSREVVVEAEKDLLNRKREKDSICKTKYPILMVHGVFFRDSNKLNYWGRVPAELIRNGATVYYGNHQSALSVPRSAEDLRLV